MAVTAMMMTAWTATAAMPRVKTIAVMTAINAVMSAPAMTGRVTIAPAMTVSVVAGMIATVMAAAGTTVPVMTVPVKIGHVKIGHVKSVAPTATAVIGSVIAVIAGRNGRSSRGIRIQLMHRRSMTANRFCRRCHPPSRAARAVA